MEKLKQYHTLMLFFFVCLFLFWESGSHSRIQVSLELYIAQVTTNTWQSSCLSLQSFGITSMSCP